MDVVFSGCTENKLYDASILACVSFFDGFSFSCQNGKIHYAQTLKHLSPVQFARDILAFDASGYDVVITDFEPLTARIARKHRLPCIGIGHQYAFLYDIPMGRGARLKRMIMEQFAACQYPVGLHWHHFGRPILPPVIPDHIMPSQQTDPSLILVYLPFENPDNIAALFKPFTDFRFVVYGSLFVNPLKNGSTVTWQKFSKTRFFDDLQQCDKIICNAGFELPSEAIFLGKKLLVKPLKGQFEQMANAMAIELLNLGTSVQTLNQAVIEKFLTRQDVSRKHFPRVAPVLADWIMKGDWKNIQSLANTLWH